MPLSAMLVAVLRPGMSGCGAAAAAGAGPFACAVLLPGAAGLLLWALTGGDAPAVKLLPAADTAERLRSPSAAPGPPASANGVQSGGPASNGDDLLRDRALLVLDIALAADPRSGLLALLTLLPLMLALMLGKLSMAAAGAAAACAPPHEGADGGLCTGGNPCAPPWPPAAAAATPLPGVAAVFPGTVAAPAMSASALLLVARLVAVTGLPFGGTTFRVKYDRPLRTGVHNHSTAQAARTTYWR